MKTKRIKRFGKWLAILILANMVFAAVFYLTQIYETKNMIENERIRMNNLYGVNQDITGTGYDRNLGTVCDNGTFVGKEENGVLSCKGIPYAEQPVGDLRWKPPVDARAQDGVYEAYYFGKSGIQTEAESERASFYPQGEDCLTLNVWSSREADASDAKRAVMVFFHGGAYGWGGTADPLYDGQNFVEAHPDVVLVTANYRIGLMGFMDFSEVEGGEGFEKSGNLGLLDQVSALRWVQRNIAQFGGDPHNVTIFGESAGASSVSLLPLVKEAKGLFRRAIAESGSVAFTYSRKECRTLTRKLLEESGASSMKELMALSEEDLIRLNEKLNDYNNFPERDGVVLPEDLYQAYASGEASDVAMLSGTNADEARYWIGEVGGFRVYKYAIPVLFGSIRDRFRTVDKPFADAFLTMVKGDFTWRFTEFMNELLFRVPAVRQAELHAESGGKHYMYYWTEQSHLEHYGACHAVELAYVFNNLNDTIYTGKKADPALAAAVQQMWVNFAKTGDPSTDEYKWTPYDSTDRMTMLLGKRIGMNSDPLPQQRVLVEPLLKYHINGQYMAVDYSLMFLKKQLLKGLMILLAVNGAIAGALVLKKLFRKRKGRQIT